MKRHRGLRVRFARPLQRSWYSRACITPPQAPKPSFKLDLDRPLRDLLREMTEQIEEQYIRKAMKRSHGNIGRCAKICGMSRRSITAKIAEYKIDKDTFKEP